MTTFSGKTAPAKPDLHEGEFDDVGRAVGALTTGKPSVTTAAPLPRPSFHRIVLAHDGTPASARATEWAAHLARLHGAHVTVVCVVPPPNVEGSAGFGWWPQLIEEYTEVQHALHESAESAVDILRGKSVDAEAVVTSGSAPREIARVAERDHADLVILGDKGRTPMARFLLGSTSEAILGRVEASVLVARTPPPARHVLVAVDGSPPSYRATAAALRYASANDSEVIVQHVLEFPEDIMVGPPEGYLKGVIEKMDLPEHPRVRYLLDAGKPAQRIVERAASEKADLIVMGARGLGTVTGLLLGSVSHRVTSAASASVLVMRESHP